MTRRPTKLGDPAVFLDNMDKRQQIAELLERHDLTLYYEEIFDRWIFDLRNKDCKTVWHRRAIDLVWLCDELLEYLRKL